VKTAQVANRPTESTYGTKKIGAENTSIGLLRVHEMCGTKKIMCTSVEIP